MTADSVLSMLSKLRHNLWARWGLLLALVVLILWLLSWLFTPLDPAKFAVGGNYVKTTTTTIILPSEELQPNYAYGMSLDGLDKEVKCPLINGLFDCSQATAPAPARAQAVLDDIYKKQGEGQDLSTNAKQIGHNTPILSVEGQMALEDLLNTPYVVTDDGTTLMLSNALPKRSDFIKEKAEWTEKCITDNGNVRRSCKRKG